MIIRCLCGNDVPISTEDGAPVLRELSWYDADSAEVRCPKCKSNALPIVAAGPVHDGTLPLRIDAKRPIEQTRKR